MKKEDNRSFSFAHWNGSVAKVKEASTIEYVPGKNQNAVQRKIHPIINSNPRISITFWTTITTIVTIPATIRNLTYKT
jgi:hypothetical protein